MGSKDQGADITTVAGRWQVVPRTLCFVTCGDDLLLMKRGEHKRIYPSHYNGVGGHLERNEDPLTGAIREIKEETGLTVYKVCYRGSTHIDTGQETGILLFIFTAETSSREVIESDEGTLHWIPIKTVLEAIRSGSSDFRFVEDLPILLPRFFSSHDPISPIFAHVSYNEADQLQFRIAEAQCT